MKHKAPCNGCDRVLCARSRQDCPAWVEYEQAKAKVDQSRREYYNMVSHSIEAQKRFTSRKGDRSSQIRFKQIRNSARRVKDRKVMGG